MTSPLSMSTLGIYIRIDKHSDACINQLEVKIQVIASRFSIRSDVEDPNQGTLEHVILWE